MSIAALVSGIFIDLDHVIDYSLQYGFPLNFKKFSHACYNDRVRKVHFLFHSWEFLLVLAVAAWISSWDMLIIGTFIGCGQHIILDKINNRASIWSYSFLWRWQHSFEVKSVFPDNFKKRDDN